MLGRERGGAERDDRLLAGLAQRDGVEVALDERDLARAADRVAGGVEPVERAALHVERRLAGVDVLAIVLALDHAAAERDHPAVRIADRHHQPPAEDVVVPLAPVVELLAEEPGALRRLERHLARGEAIAELGPAERRVAEAGLLRDLVGDPALLEVRPARRAPGRPEVLLEELGGDLAGPEQLAARLELRLLLRIEGEGDPALGGERLHRLHEALSLELHQEADDVPTLLAAEALVRPALRVHVEGRGPLPVERAEAAEAAAGPLELHMAADHLDDVGPLHDLADLVLPDQQTRILDFSGGATPRPASSSRARRRPCRRPGPRSSAAPPSSPRPCPSGPWRRSRRRPRRRGRRARPR